MRSSPKKKCPIGGAVRRTKQQQQQQRQRDGGRLLRLTQVGINLVFFLLFVVMLLPLHVFMVKDCFECDHGATILVHHNRNRVVEEPENKKDLLVVTTAKEQLIDDPQKTTAESAMTTSSIGRYTPTLLTAANVRGRQEHDDRKMIHIVKSRFMQYQPELVSLGWARYWQFKELCMPSMIKQTNQNFLWFIYTDPDLEPELLQTMVELLKPYPNFYLIKSLSNEKWKGGQAQNIAQSTVYTGNQTELEIVMALREELPTLETRLDADDALHVGYLEEIQQQATKYFLTQEEEEKVNWMYWCVNSELGWTWLGHLGLDKEQQEYGVLGSKPYSNFCPTPGMTVGYASSTSVESIYTRRHSVLVESLLTTQKDSENFCGVGRKGPDCYQIIDKFDYPSFRSRTPTSASMAMNKYTEKKLNKFLSSTMAANKRWEALYLDFGISRSNVRFVNDYLTRNISNIVRDAIMGQCTKGHSCRQKAKADLKLVLERY